MHFLPRLKRALGMFVHYYIKPNPSKFGFYGKNTHIGRPCDLKKPSNIFLHDFVRIGPKSNIMTSGRGNFIMKQGCLCSENLVVVTSNHCQRIGEYLNSNNEDAVYGDVVVEEDVWIGVNVTLLAGTSIGRGAIIGACSVVTNDIPPYSIAVGNPAKVIKLKWTIDEIITHEEKLYAKSERFTKQQLEEIRNSINLKNLPILKGQELVIA